MHVHPDHSDTASKKKIGFAPSMIKSGVLQDMTAFNCLGEWSRQRKMEVCKQKKAVWTCARENWWCTDKCPHKQKIDACVSKSSDPRCEIDGRVSRRLSVHLSSCTHGFCVAPALAQHWLRHAQLGHCDHSARAYLLGVSVAYVGIRTGHYGSRTDSTHFRSIF